MQIVYRTGDLIEAAEPVIIHGTNMQGKFNAGLARAIRDRLPFAYHAYRTAHQKYGLQLGQVIWAINVTPGERSRIVGNAITQEFYGNEPGHKYVDDDAVQIAIQTIDHFVRTCYWNMDIDGITPIETVAMPLIGAGLGGGDWSVISQIIEQHSRHFTPVVYTRDGVIP